MKEEKRKQEPPIKKIKKYCFVPMCGNTLVTAPNKTYFSVPKNPATREEWCKAVKRDNGDYLPLSCLATHYCCEDHFNLEEDLQNYWECKLMKGVRKRLKKGVLPHIFECQEESPAIHASFGALKRKRRLVQNAPQESTIDTPVKETSTPWSWEWKNLKLEEDEGIDKALQVNEKLIPTTNTTSPLWNVKTIYLPDHSEIISEKGIKKEIEESSLPMSPIRDNNEYILGGSDSIDKSERTLKKEIKQEDFYSPFEESALPTSPTVNHVEYTFVASNSIDRSEVVLKKEIKIEDLYLA